MKSTQSILLLAAGESHRFGGIKQLAYLSNEPMLRYVTRQLLELARPLTLVIGAHTEEVQSCIADLPVHIVRFDGWQEGMGSSMAAGVRSILETHPHADALLLCLADQPLLPLELLRKMLIRHAEAPERLLVCRYSDHAGPPVLWPRDCFEDLTLCRGPRGANWLIEREQHRVEYFACGAGGIDVDTVQDWEQVRQQLDGKTPNN